MSQDRVGICGDRSPANLGNPPYICDLPVGHVEWHEADSWAAGEPSTRTSWSSPDILAQANRIFDAYKERLAERDEALAEVASLRQQLAVCSCGTSPMTYEGPEPDCPVHGAVRAFNEANAEIAALRQQLDEARGECEHCGDMRSQLSAVEADLDDANEELGEAITRQVAAEADRDRLLDEARQTRQDLIDGLIPRIGLIRVSVPMGEPPRDMAALALEVIDQAWAELEETRADAERVEGLYRVLEKHEARSLAAEADNARLLDVYRAAEAWREWIIARAESIGPDEHALASKLDAYRAGAPAEAPDGERA